jgi:hypothetical protein
VPADFLALDKASANLGHVGDHALAELADRGGVLGQDGGGGRRERMKFEVLAIGPGGRYIRHVEIPFADDPPQGVGNFFLWKSRKARASRGGRRLLERISQPENNLALKAPDRLLCLGRKPLMQRWLKAQNQPDNFLPRGSLHGPIGLLAHVCPH